MIVVELMMNLNDGSIFNFYNGQESIRWKKANERKKQKYRKPNMNTKLYENYH